MALGLATKTFAVDQRHAAGAGDISACSLTPKDIWVYIDNAGREPLKVTVDDQPATTVARRQVCQARLPAGEHDCLSRPGIKSFATLLATWCHQTALVLPASICSTLTS